MDQLLVDTHHQHLCLGNHVRDLLPLLALGTGSNDLPQLQTDVGHGALRSVVQVEEARAVVQHDTRQDVDLGAQQVT